LKGTLLIVEIRTIRGRVKSPERRNVRRRGGIIKSRRREF
jgi:hypothetical protein